MLCGLRPQAARGGKAATGGGRGRPWDPIYGEIRETVMGGDGIKSDKMGVTGNVRKHPMGEHSHPNQTQPRAAVLILKGKLPSALGNKQTLHSA